MTTHDPSTLVEMKLLVSPVLLIFHASRSYAFMLLYVAADPFFSLTPVGGRYFGLLEPTRTSALSCALQLRMYKNPLIADGLCRTLTLDAFMGTIPMLVWSRDQGTYSRAKCGYFGILLLLRACFVQFRPILCVFQVRGPNEAVCRDDGR